MEIKKTVWDKHFPKEKINLDESLFETNYNKCYYFLLPLTGFDVTNYKDEFINCYYQDADIDYLKRGCLYIQVHRTERVDKRLKELDNYLINYYICDDIYMYVLDINCPDYFKIISGNYSALSNDYLKTVHQYTFSTDINKNSKTKYLIRGIVKKDEKLAEFVSKLIGIDIKDEKEYWEKFILEREIFRFKK